MVISINFLRFYLESDENRLRLILFHPIYVRFSTSRRYDGRPCVRPSARPSIANSSLPSVSRHQTVTDCHAEAALDGKVNKETPGDNAYKQYQFRQEDRNRRMDACQTTSLSSFPRLLPFALVFSRFALVCSCLLLTALLCSPLLSPSCYTFVLLFSYVRHKL